jgi:hypothetical protein
MEPLVLAILKAAWPTSKEAVDTNKMSAEDLSVSAPTEEPHRFSNSQPPQQDNTTDMHNISTPSYLHTNKTPSPLYTKLPLPSVPTNSIRLLWNNTNALQIENEVTLTKSIDITWNTNQQY